MAIDETKRILGIPDDYLVGIVPASDTGAFEMAMWHMLGERPVDVAYWESFGKGWLNDIQNHLKLPNVRIYVSICGIWVLYNVIYGIFQMIGLLFNINTHSTILISCGIYVCNVVIANIGTIFQGRLW